MYSSGFRIFTVRGISLCKIEPGDAPILERFRRKSIRLKPLEQWVCDECGEVIEEASHGYLEWVVDADTRAHGFRIVHQAHHSPRQPGSDCYRYLNEPSSHRNGP